MCVLVLKTECIIAAAMGYGYGCHHPTINATIIISANYCTDSGSRTQQRAGNKWPYTTSGRQARVAAGGWRCFLPAHDPRSDGQDVRLGVRTSPFGELTFIPRPGSRWGSV
eukprot:1372904-Pleurochrysis_carterae.AAC.1